MKDLALKLKPIDEADLEWARAIRNANTQYFFDTRPLTKAKMNKWFEGLKNRPNFKFYKIVVGSEAVGSISTSTERYGKKVIEIGHVLIDTKYRRQGIFKAVLGILERRYRKPFTLDVRVDNKEALKAYQALGFEVDVYRMWKEVDKSGKINR